MKLYRGTVLALLLVALPGWAAASQSAEQAMKMVRLFIMVDLCTKFDGKALVERLEDGELGVQCLLEHDGQDSELPGKPDQDPTPELNPRELWDPKDLT